jgi:hypothetical protein
MSGSTIYSIIRQNLELQPRLILVGKVVRYGTEAHDVGTI